MGTPQAAGQHQEIRFGPFRLDRANARLLRAGRPVALTPKAFDVLHYLATRPDRLVTKDDLLSAVWPDVIVSDASIKVCVREIRKALDDDIKTPAYIETVHRRGYRFIAPITPGGATTSVAAGPEPAPPPDGPRAAGAAPTPTTPPRRPLVGRGAESRRLRDWFAQAVRGGRQVVFVAGGAGGGKTALVEDFIDQAQASAAAPTDRPLVLAGHCFEQFGTREPYMPVWEALDRLARERPSAALSNLLARHAAAHAAGAPPAPVPAPAAGPTQPPHSAGGPGAMAERMLRDMADGVEALAADAPLILLLEDVHWADYSTLDLISALARRRGPARLMVLATYRPAEVLDDEHPLREVVHELASRGLCHELPLEFLDEAAVAQYLATRFPGCVPPEALARRLHQRTDGHPLFLVHLVNDLVEQRVVREDGGRWRFTGPEAAAGGGGAADPGGWLAVLDTQIPHSVRAMIDVQLGRLDRRQQQALEAAAAAGVEFSAAEVAAALAGPAPAGHPAPPGAGDVVQAEQVCEGLARRHRFLEERGVEEWPDGTVATRYRFAHELYHNAVYERVPVARRVRLHLTIGSRLEAAWGTRAAEEAAGLAVHFEQGRDWPRAVHYLRQAAQAAGRQYAHREAVRYLRRALAAVERLPPDVRAEHELAVLMSLGVNLQVTKGFAAPEVQDIHARAHALCRQGEPVRPGAATGEVELSFPVQWGIWLFHKVRSDLWQARDMAHRLLKMALDSDDSALIMQAHQAMCVTALCLGDFAVTADHAARAAALYDPARHPANTQVYGQDPGVATQSFGAVALWLMGRPREAMDASRRALDLAARLGQPSSIAVSIHFAAMLHQCRGDAPATEQFAQQTIDLAAEEGFSFWLAGGTVLRGWAWAAQGRGGEGIDEIRRGLDAWLATGSRTYHTYYLGLLADALLRHGRAAEALPPLDEALAAAATMPEGIYEAELCRLKARALVQAGADVADDAEGCLTQAVTAAQRQGARCLEFRAATDLTALLRSRGRAKEAKKVLASVAAAAGSCGDATKPFPVPVPPQPG